MLRVQIWTDNDAFAGNGEQEVAKLLRQLADRIEEGQCDGRIMDSNGNRCGSFDLRLDREQEVER